MILIRLAKEANSEPKSRFFHYIIPTKTLKITNNFRRMKILGNISPLKCYPKQFK